MTVLAVQAMRAAIEARRSRRIGAILVLAIAYAVVGKLALQLAFVHPSASPVWPPTGIALAALLLLGRALWPGVLLGAFAVNVTTAGTVWTSLGIAAGNTLEAVLGAWLVERFARADRAFDRPKDTVRYAVLAGFVSTTVSATCGVTSLCLGGAARWSQYADIWLTWWLGDVGGALVLAPVLVLWALHGVPHWRGRQLLEGAALMLAVLAVAFVVFSDALPSRLTRALTYLGIPLLVWPAFRFGSRDAATVGLVLSALATWATLRGSGPFVTDSPNESLVLLQAFMGVVAVTALAVAAVAAERQSAEAELRRVAAVVGSTQDGVIATDSAGRITMWNPGAEVLFGYSTAEALGRHVSILVALDQIQDQERLLERARRGERVEPVETVLCRRDGGPAPVSLTVSPIRDAGSRLAGFSAIARDVRERLRLEETRRRSQALEDENRRIQETSRLKNEFMANMSHELRTPLHAVSGFTEVLLRDRTSPLTERQAECLQHIRTASEQLLGLIEAVLDMAQIEAGKMALEPRRVDVAALAAEVTGVLAALAERKAIRVETRVADGAAEAVVDPMRLKQILYNYLSNALKFTPEGGRVSVRIGPENASSMRIEVEDTGIGIGPADLGRLFVEFQQLDSSSAKLYPGTGLGLALTRRIVEAHGGRVGVRSTPGRGSVFFAVLPR